MDKIIRQSYLSAMGIESWVSRFVEAEIEPLKVESKLRVEPVSMPSPSLPHSIEKSGLKKQREMDAPPAWMDEAPIPRDDDYSGLEDAEFDVFYDQAEVKKPSIPDMDWNTLSTFAKTCDLCALSKGRKKIVFGDGDRHADLFIIGDSPSNLEEKMGHIFVGDGGQLFDNMLSALGLVRDKVYLTSLTKCTCPSNRSASPQEIASCDALLIRQIQLIQPKVILCLGRMAAQTLLGLDLPMAKLRLMNKQHLTLHIPIVASYHPAYLLHSAEQKAKAWQDIQKIMQFVG